MLSVVCQISRGFFRWLCHLSLRRPSSCVGGLWYTTGSCPSPPSPASIVAKLLLFAQGDSFRLSVQGGRVAPATCPFSRLPPLLLAAGLLPFRWSHVRPSPRPQHRDLPGPLVLLVPRLGLLDPRIVPRPVPPVALFPSGSTGHLVSSQSHGGAATSGIPQHGAYPWESLPPDALEAPPPGTPQHRWSLWDESPPAERALRVEQRVSNVGTCLTLVVDVLDQLGAYQRRTRHPGALPPMLSGQEQTVAVASAVQILQMLPEIGFVPGSPGSALGPGPAALRRLVLAALQAPLDIVPAVASVGWYRLADPKGDFSASSVVKQSPGLISPSGPPNGG
ncbi:unnamed protein product [Closterium sp. NIES-64]|nr:unnamed protein product [Closterium sp. NIES-64]